MKKGILLVILSLFAATTVSAAPLRSGLYIGAKAGGMRTEWKKNEKSVEDTTFPFALALGLRLRNFRVEAEYMFSTKAKSGNYEQKTDTVFAQLYYDVPFKAPIRPFVNVGVGRHTTKVTRTEDVEYSEDRKGWAYNVGAGVTWNLSTAVNIDIGYRYLDVGDLKTRNGTVHPKQHIAYIGWRYVF